MILFLDGDNWCIAEDGFTNLQESACEFVPVDSLVGKALSHFANLLIRVPYDPAQPGSFAVRMIPPICPSCLKKYRLCTCAQEARQIGIMQDNVTQ